MAPMQLRGPRTGCYSYAPAVPAGPKGSMRVSDFGRIMGLDVGDVRTGIALSDPMRMIASPREVLAVKDTHTDIAAILRLVKDEEVTQIVVGMPLDQAGGQGKQADKVMAFVEALRAAAPVPVYTVDERFSTASAQRSLIAAGARRDKRKQVVDKVAAANILQSYLDRLAMQRRAQG